MGKDKFLLASESVTEGHPDKVCDQISDSVLDEVLRQDPQMGRVACETYITMGLIIVGGEITTRGYVDIHKLCRKLLLERISLRFEKGSIWSMGNKPERILLKTKLVIRKSTSKAKGKNSKE